jgi:putative membrane protein
MEKRTNMQYLFITLKGMAMGIAELVPGVSGGTIAFVTGIYEEFISSINNVSLSTFKTLKNAGFAAFWKKLNGNFLLVLFVGMMISILSFSKLITWLLEFHPIPIWAFFFGLVLASVIFVAKAINKWNVSSIVLFTLGTVVAFYITTLPPSANTDSLPFLFFSGALAICAMVLPGISGSFILVLLGSYKTILDAVNEKDLKIVITVGLGAVFGILSFARLLKWMFENYKDATLAVLTGFILGSLNKIWPWKKILEVIQIGKKEIIIDENISPFAFEGDSQLTFAIVSAMIGFSLIFILEKTASKK